MAFLRVVFAVFIVGLASDLVARCQAGCPTCPPTWTLHFGSCYRLFATPQTFDEAEKHCQQIAGSRKGHLVSIHNKAENQFVYRMWTTAIVNYNYLWIGMDDRTKEGHFHWTDGSNVDYNAWGESQPDNHNNEDCVHLRPQKTYADWNDIPCSHKYAYVCKMSTTRVG